MSNSDFIKTVTVQPIYWQLGFLLLMFAALYYPFIQTMVEDWSRNDNYSHGYLIPFIFAYMMYHRRKDLRKSEIVPVNWGLTLVALAITQLIVAKIGSEYFLQRTSMILLLFGITLFFFGKEITKKLSIPILYLIFMIPIPAIVWNKFAFPMQLFASSITEDVIRLLGISVFREGNVLHLAQTTLEVVDACSGLRSLVSMLALSSALAYLSDLRISKRWILFFSAVPIAILVNIIRLTITASLASRFGEKAAQGFLHDASGYLIFIVGLAMLLGIYTILGKKGF